MPQGYPVFETGAPSNISSSTKIADGPGRLLGIFVASASSTPTVKVWDNTAGSGTILVNTFTPVAGTWYSMPFQFVTGCFVTIGGTVDCTVSWARN